MAMDSGTPTLGTWTVLFRAFRGRSESALSRHNEGEGERKRIEV